MATSLEGFVQQLAVAYIAHGYYFYVSGFIPEGKDPETVDRKLLDKYGVRLSKFARYRRKALGQASLQYLRFERFFVMIATHGKHPFFWTEKEGGEGERIKDVRRTPLRFAGYSLSSRRKSGTGSTLVTHVRVDQEVYLEMRDAFVDQASKRSKAYLEYQFWNFPFEPYAPVRRQAVSIFTRVNRARKEAGLELLRTTCLRLKRRPTRPFGSVLNEEAG
ncbi:MAG TPA: hypothetical protein VM120_25935 [Bryobacteraceae bacterium]|nr:hypothetical protein [Bryobacteraceae bacterium]